jgi:glycosyltransferase involved in cell wall biosynthesis
MLKPKKIKFSFIMPIFNVQDYLEEAILSILDQTLDFKENVELVLVNDGSTDKSEDVCKKYEALFPENVIYLKQTNKGVSSARNLGIKNANGKYFCFLDSDDKLSKNTLKEVLKSFEDNYAEVDVVAIKMEFFEGKTGPHRLNYKFSKDRIIDINKEPGAIQLSGASCFIKSSIFLDKKIKFDENIKYAEDAKLLTTVLDLKQKYAVLENPTYLYRRRVQSSSAMDRTKNDPEWYIKQLERVHQAMVDDSIAKHGYVTKYTQSVIMYDLGGRLHLDSSVIPAEVNITKYKTKLLSILSKIDDDIILADRFLARKYKIMLIGKNHNLNVAESAYARKGKVYLDDTLLYDISKKIKFVIEFLETSNGTLEIEGYLKGYKINDFELIISSGDKHYESIPFQHPGGSSYFLGENFYEQVGEKITLPSEEAKLTAYIKTSEGKYKIGLEYKRFSGLSNDRYSYVIKNGMILKNKGDGSLILSRSNNLAHIKSEIFFMLKMLKKSKYNLFLFRLLHPSMHFHRKKIWLISDRISAADDNGEALFKYVSKNCPTNVKPYFAISAQSSDYKRLKKYGRVVDRNSWKYKKLFILSSKIISSHADDFVINAFAKDERYFRGIIKFDYVFLQHGITKDDISGWLNKYKKNIKLFLAAAESEYKSLLGSNYAYNKDIVKLTGFPRHDYLENRPAGKLIIAPTWRKSLATDADSNGNRAYDEKFKDTEYYSFYQKILSDKRLIKALRDKNMIGEFYLHPSFSSQYVDFIGNEAIEIMKYPYSYKNALSKGDIMVTDYSSLAFDFAYLRKPVIYTQFDSDIFFEGHIYKQGYFSYDENGFGPVANTYDEAVKEIINQVMKGTSLSKKYKVRVESFFGKKQPGLNSSRVVEAILEIDQKRQ